jgi:hypothetical protein
MTDNIIPEDLKNTHCYTYTVTMVVQILAPTEELAKEKLDRDGGYVSSRIVELKDSMHVYTDESNVATTEKQKPE